MRRLRVTVWLAALGLAQALALSVEAVDQATAAPQSAVLDYFETDYPLLTQGLSASERATPFSKEPPLNKGSVCRGELQFGTEKENQIPFLWEKGERRLHLDLNRNGDLTDDLKGGYRSGANSESFAFQTFGNVRLNLKTSSGIHPFKIELALHQFRSTSPYVTASLQSYWRARASWNGEEIELGVVESLLGWAGQNKGTYLVLRPWSDHTNRVDLVNGTPDAIRLPRQLFWRGIACDLSCGFEGSGSAQRCRVQWTSRQPALGDLKLEGQHLNRIVLEDTRGYAAVLDRPTGIQRLPAGSYQTREIWLKRGAAEAVCSQGRSIVVSTATPASLLIGGPLTNSATVTRRGKSLVLEYRLAGVDDSTYRMIRQRQQTPPAVAVYSQGKQVATGTFAYG